MKMTSPIVILFAIMCALYFNRIDAAKNCEAARGPWRYVPGIGDWCNTNCNWLPSYCPSSHCTCTDASVAPPPPAGKTAEVAPPTKGKSTCENYFLGNGCEEGHEIDVVDAIYGRKGLENEPWCMGQIGDPADKEKARTDNCKVPNAKDILRRECQGERFCSVQATDAFFGSTCRPGPTYLKIWYRCVKSAPVEYEEKQICYMAGSDLTCPAGKKIKKIFQAMKGRPKLGECYNEHQQSLSCEEDVTAQLQEKITLAKCVGQSTCVVWGRWFPDNEAKCPGYLDIKFQCE